MVYEQIAWEELTRWKRKLRKNQSMTSRFTKKWQNKFNGMVPEKFHTVVTTSIKNMVQATIYGTEVTSKHKPLQALTLKEQEEQAKALIEKYKKTAAIEGAGTGFGGILLGMADFPLLLSIKMKFLHDMASVYGFDVRDYRERLFLLLIFQLTFSSDDKKQMMLNRLENWEIERLELPAEDEYVSHIDWKEFQLSYRDYIDIPKMLQLIPGFGAIVGATVNYHFLDLLGETAMNGYRMRVLKELN
ncbi:ecsC [Alkalihalobacillus alcalophilus ATCC 27647 = CGMCC 1.3604]|uniref:EcsC n=1 Tax=Alkalihalobacillus alcalophilus ATCC 27647 = CGMCC 1.3604 TaxID=1218173 RepID=A0A094YX18_ALKAL|nr:EcsC family protein [Alkalihalobacillus alcalophilus]KGA98072.1 ecsC [Alkalihalobacillus alcalophilus ATCC 27647 = CGMCC 1.3604]MED1561042.1 EcsC family protein [Alkalihalobacillus alcalophilus]THG88335.1 ecsC [Alkalihalobacillus alcalophilus ATCC 27647 = CGMCC 1.3604]